MATIAKPHDLFAADSDVAALVYARGDEPDALLEAFTADLAARRLDVAGLLQRRRGNGTDSWVDFRLVPDRGILGTGRSCADALSAAEPSLLDAVRRRPDLLVVSRFGSAELSGGGLLRVLVEAVRLDVPILIAVPQALFSDWLGFSGGLTIRLDCHRSGLDRWWASLSKPPPSRRPFDTICERAK
ncbi:MAG TPA: DUF2478 domain-containing protein [Aliidongia sp.]|uniref:DUF2478 domain-containing protein n=1 Tax=Aliidongia sp. TaxID=1914230 RepID=UPI002DDD6B67|nr:DUF2478 domain-containing protein [Aliidongia sp.]HEV2676114.1 DUF2478 domain-containing protein [Aliidongia sp.]